MAIWAIGYLSCDPFRLQGSALHAARRLLLCHGISSKVIPLAPTWAQRSTLWFGRECCRKHLRCALRAGRWEGAGRAASTLLLRWQRVGAFTPCMRACAPTAPGAVELHATRLKGTNKQESTASSCALCLSTCPFFDMISWAASHHQRSRGGCIHRCFKLSARALSSCPCMHTCSPPHSSPPFCMHAFPSLHPVPGAPCRSCHGWRCGSPCASRCMHGCAAWMDAMASTGYAVWS